MFEISQIRCFVALAEELHVGHAAGRLNMTQSPLSRQIQLLEHHVGTQLVDRGSRGVRLTAAGKAFFPDAARILRQANEASATAQRVATGERGTLAIGFTARPRIRCRTWPGCARQSGCWRWCGGSAPTTRCCT